MNRSTWKSVGHPLVQRAAMRPRSPYFALEGERGVARDHEAVAYARQIGREVLRDAVGEIVRSATRIAEPIRQQALTL